jgi:Ca2+-binding EF-hand superfamily protein
MHSTIQAGRAYMSIEQLESKILSADGLNSLSNDELYQLAKHFVGDAPPSHIPRETVINMRSEQESIKSWQSDVKAKAAKMATKKVSQAVQNVQSTIEDNSDNPMAAKIKQSFGTWLKDSGYTVQELTVKLDSNSDGIISIEEISNFIVELTGSQPPGWVLSNISSILDKNMDGEILVSELWVYLEELGFNIPVIDEPEIELPVEQEPIIEEEDLDEFESELNADTAEYETVEKEIPEIPQSEELEVEQTIETDTEHDSSEEVSVSTTVEKTIEILEKSRLHSEANEIISNSKSGQCTLKVARIERNLMVNDNYRGGKTLVGLLDGGPFSVAVLFEPEFNDFVEQNITKNKMVSFNASLFEWSSGLRQAKLKGNSLTLID